jgi:hypothetical protein
MKCALQDRDKDLPRVAFNRTADNSHECTPMFIDESYHILLMIIYLSSRQSDSISLVAAPFSWSP